MIKVLSDPKARLKPCIRCGYSLRGNLDATHCPECGLSVWLSLNQNDSLDWSNPPWLMSLAAGTAFMGAAQVLGLIGWALYLLPEEMFRRGMLFSLVAMGAYFIAYHAAALLFVCRNEHRHPDRLQSHRLALQIVSGIGIFIGLMLLMPPVLGRVPAELLFFVVDAMLAASALTTWLFLRRLAQRVPNSTVVRFCSWLLLLPALAAVKTLPFFTLYLIYIFSWVFWLAPLIYFPATAVLLGWFALTFRRSSGYAAQHWAKETLDAPH